MTVAVTATTRIGDRPAPHVADALDEGGRTFSTPIWIGPEFRGEAAEDGESVDLVVIGGGILGLSTALHAAKSGRTVRVLEARLIGECAAGLSGGQVIPGLKHDPDWLLERFAPQQGGRIVNFAATTAEAVFQLIAAERLQVAHTRNGWIQAAHSRQALKAAEARVRQWRSRGADVELLDYAQVRELTGAQGYCGGWLDKRAGVIDPLAYVRELARVAQAAGARIAEREAAGDLRREAGRWSVVTREGKRVTGRSVLVATNAYSDSLLPGLSRSFLPVHSFQIATAPLPHRVHEEILPGGHAVSDSRRVLIYFRKTPEGRLVLGGRGRLAVPGSPRDWLHLERALVRLFPSLAGLPIERRWFGRVAVTLDFLPHIHEPEPGLVAVVGCQGRGIGLMTSLGSILAKYMVERDPLVLPFPITPIRPIPLHRFRKIGIAAMMGWYLFKDRWESRDAT
jgi:glycine/D-amino acid oxidase-like deaminating enzyme